MSQKLCYRCREFYEKKFGSSYWVSPSNHCHHPEPEEKPKPKPKCWCELWRFPEVINLTDSGNYTFKPKFCPECGKKLKGE